MVKVEILDKLEDLLSNDNLSYVEEYSSYCHDESLYGVTIYVKIDEDIEIELNIYYDLGYPGIIGKVIFGFAFIHKIINGSKVTLKGIPIDIYNPDYKRTIYLIIKEYGATNEF